MDNKNLRLNDKTNVMHLLPIIIMIAIVPLIVRGKLVILDTMRYLFWRGEHVQFDAFTYWKAALIIVTFIISLLIYVILMKKKKITYNLEKKYAIPLLVMIVTLVLSSVFAIDKTTAILGFPDMTQGFFVLLAYIFTVIYVSTIVGTERSVEIILKSFAILIIVEGVLGVGQYFGHDFFKTELGQNIITPNNITLTEGMKFMFGPKTIYATMFNTNFVGSFAVMAIPVMFAMVASSKKWIDRIIYMIALVSALFISFGCNSRAGYVGLIAGTVFTIILMRRYIVKKWKISIFVIALAIISLFVLNKISDGYLLQRIQTLNIFSDEVTDRFGYKDAFYLEDLSVDGTDLTIKSNQETIVIKYDKALLNMFDENGTPLEVAKGSAGYYDIMIAGKKSNFAIKPNNDYAGYDIKTVEGSVVKFMITDTIKKITNTGNLLPVKKYDYVEFLDERGRMATTRGYIWSRSIPLIKNYIFYGAGPDNFIYAFPQGDVLGKINVMPAQMNIVVDKPHNMYIQMAINTGLISLIAFLALILIYMASVIKSMWKSNFDYAMDKVNVAILISIVGYLAAGMFNDQINSVAPIFYVLLGLGIAVNRLCLVEQRRQKYMSEKR